MKNTALTPADLSPSAAMNNALFINFNPDHAIKRIEKLMGQLKMQEPGEGEKPNDYQHGMIDGLGNALAILIDEKKGQMPKELSLCLATTKAELIDKTNLDTPPWEVWGEQPQEISA